MRLKFQLIIMMLCLSMPVGTIFLQDDEEIASYQEPEEQPVESFQEEIPDFSVPMSEQTEVPSLVPNQTMNVPVMPSTVEEETKPTTPEKFAPEEIEPSEVVGKEESEEQLLNIDTVSQEEEPQGNWLFKRIWWEYAEARYEKLRSLTNAVQELRLAFLAERNKIERDVLDPFYVMIGVGQGELQELIDSLLKTTETVPEKKTNKKLSEAEQEININIERDRAELEELKRDVNTVINLENGLDQAINTLMQLLSRVKQYEQEAWQDFKQISRLLNDKKARELFYRIKSAVDNVSSSYDYLKGSYRTSFDELIKKITDQVDRIKQTLGALKERGITLKGGVQRVQEPVMQTAEGEKKEELQEQQPAQGWFAKIVSPFAWLGRQFIAIIRSPYDLVAGWWQGGTKQEQEETPI